MLQGAEKTVPADLRRACAPVGIEDICALVGDEDICAPGRACGRRYLFRPGVVL